MILQTPYTLRNATDERRTLINQLWLSNFTPVANDNLTKDHPDYFNPVVAEAMKESGDSGQLSGLSTCNQCVPAAPDAYEVGA